MKVTLIKAVTIYPPIGLAYLAAKLESLNIKVSIIDYVVGGFTPDTLRQRLIAEAPDLIGINCLSFNTFPSFEIARIAKATLPHVPIVFGGHHPTADPVGTLRHKEVDFAVIGEGEETLAELALAMKNGGAGFEAIAGLVFKDQSGHIVTNKPRHFIEDLDTIPYPAYHLLDLEKYFKFPDMHGIVKKRDRFMPILTSRGCPYGCIYCCKSFGYKFRSRSPQHVFNEILLLYETYKVREIHIEDDTFNVDAPRAKAILDLIITRKLDLSIQFPSGLRADLVDEELMDKIKKAGAFMVAFGIETASPRMMQLINKRLDLKKVEYAIDLAVGKGVWTWGYFLLGLPDETREEMEQTIAFAQRSRLHVASFSTPVPFPGTKLFESLGDKKEEIRQRFYEKEVFHFGRPIARLSRVPDEELARLRLAAKKRFYDLKRIFRIAMLIRNARDIRYFWRKFKTIILK
ncbi:MAG: B12-binding domain-containing radical SAM protein [Lentisphaerae bacterium]|nr:B12-binding domain-containing radical SAM protein [Lentisphaerota bacterium]